MLQMIKVSNLMINPNPSAYTKVLNEIREEENEI